MDELRLRIAQLVREVGLAWGRRQEIITAHDLIDALEGIVDNNRQVIGPVHALVRIRRGLAAAAQDEIIHLAVVLAGEGVVDGEGGSVGTQAYGWHAVLSSQLGALGGPFIVAKRAAGARVLSWDGVWGAGGFLDVLARAVALKGGKLGECLLISRVAILLVDDLPIPVQAERGEVLQLALRRLPRGALRVNVLHAHKKAAPAAPGVEPSQQRRAEVTQMQIAGRARGIAPGGAERIHAHQSTRRPARVGVLY